MDPSLKKTIAGNANTPHSLAIFLSSILTKSIPAPSASSSMCSISMSTCLHCLQSSLSANKARAHQNPAAVDVLADAKRNGYKILQKNTATFSELCLIFANIFRFTFSMCSVNSMFDGSVSQSKISSSSSMSPAEYIQCVHLKTIFNQHF